MSKLNSAHRNVIVSSKSKNILKTKSHFSLRVCLVKKYKKYKKSKGWGLLKYCEKCNNVKMYRCTPVAEMLTPSFLKKRCNSHRCRCLLKNYIQGDQLSGWPL